MRQAAGQNRPKPRKPGHRREPEDLRRDRPPIASRLPGDCVEEGGIVPFELFLDLMGLIRRDFEPRGIEVRVRRGLGEMRAGILIEVRPCVSLDLAIASAVLRNIKNGHKGV